MELDEMPERIWANPDAGYCTTVGPNTYTTEYIRADLYTLPSSSVSELVGRLRRSHLEYSDGVPVGYGEPVNPDGPEAAEVLTTLSTRNAELEREVKRLREALEFYADTSKYPAPFTGGLGELYYDCGQIANQALEASTPALKVTEEEWREIEQAFQPRIRDGYTAVKISRPGFWFVKGPGPAAAQEAGKP